MKTDQAKVKFALSFPQGLVFFMENDNRFSGDDIGAIYFLPQADKNAFIVWGERKELFGKHAVTVRTNPGPGARNSGYAYSVVYEFLGGRLADARLVKDQETIYGALADQKTLRDLEGALARKEIVLRGRSDAEPDSVFNVARFPDGRLLIQLLNKNELYLGRDGDFKKLDAQLAVQGGCSMHYMLPTGEPIDLPYGYGGPGRKDIPTFAGVTLSYVEPHNADPAAYGLRLDARMKHLDPFSPKQPGAVLPSQGTPPKPPAP